MALPIREIPAGGKVDIEAWARSTPSVVGVVAGPTPSAVVSPMRGISTDLEIPLDQEAGKTISQERREAKVLKHRPAGEREARVVGEDDGGVPTGYVRRPGGELRRRDSLKRREALLKGKEGSRRRQKWENDRLVGNPAAQPPEPHDWAPHPTHPVQDVPYLLAPLWDQHYANASRLRAEQARQAAASATAAAPAMPRELKEKLKRARGARSLLQQLEEQVRAYVCEWEEHQDLQAEGWDVDVYNDRSDADEANSEEEVVFVGRAGAKGSGQRDRKRKREPAVAGHGKLVYDSLLNDQDGSFGRWLVHSIASYYNLQTWSVTTGDPARREAYVGIPEARRTRRASSAASENMPGPAVQLPRPLWVML